MKSCFVIHHGPAPAPETTTQRRRRSGLFDVETVPYTNRSRYVLFPHGETTRAAGECAFARYKKEHAADVLDGYDPMSVRVRRITSDIVRAIPRGLAITNSRPPPDWLGQLPWEVIVVRDTATTAITWPAAGKIVISTEFLSYLNTDADIAMVIAHEVGHVVARHTAEMLYVVSIVLKLPFLRRRCEVEADRIGILLLAAAGYDPHLGLQVWRKLAMIEIRHLTLHNYLSSYFKEHPLFNKRLRLLSRPKVIKEALELYTHTQAVASAAAEPKIKPCITN